MIPTGGNYTIDAEKAKIVCEQVHARIVLPMHFRTDTYGFPDVDHLDKFTALCDDVVYSDKSEVIIDKNTPKQTLILTPYFLKK